MSMDDELLMRFADGELAEHERREVEAALATDPTLQRRVAVFRAQRDRLRAALAAPLEEPVPKRLREVVARTHTTSTAKVVDLARRRAGNRITERLRAWSWPEAGALAASVLLGVVIAQLLGRGTGEALHGGPDGFTAGRIISRALSTQLANTQPADAAVRVGLTFENQHGELCRTFVQRDSGISGIACRRGGDWRVGLALSGSDAGSAGSGGLRTAGSELAPALIQAVEAQIRGEPLDASAEAKARALKMTLVRVMAQHRKAEARA